MDPTKLIKVRKVGTGSFGDVYEGRITGLDESTCVAIKEIKKSATDRTALMEELRAMSKVSHDGVVSLIGACTKETLSAYAIVTEFMELSQFDVLYKYLMCLCIASIALSLF